MEKIITTNKNKEYGVLCKLKEMKIKKHDINKISIDAVYLLHNIDSEQLKSLKELIKSGEIENMIDNDDIATI